ncbi:MAG: NAD(P)/FAD-dependent oxidoreductase [Aquincola tertiaricarbonis]
MERIDCVVIGAGVVGLAVARALALAGREVMIVEAENAIGTHTSARNSEVVHAGISYAPGSLKGRLCVAGRQALERYCAQRGIGYRRIGKLIVAVEEAELPELQRYLPLAAAQGVHDLRLLSADEARVMEPAVRCVGALHSPSTGIVDSHGLMLAYLGDAERAGATLALCSQVLGGQARAEGIVLRIGDGAADESMEVLCRTVVNAAGLGAQRVALAIAGMPVQQVPPLHHAVGHYFTLAGASPFNHLVYPTGRDGALRAHVTIDLGGQCKFGPDLSWRDGVDYRFDPSRAPAFYGAVRRYYPGLPDGALQPGYTGIRPRLAGPGSSLHNTAADFMLQGAAEHGVRGLFNLFGIESPGLTASLAIGELVAARLAQDGSAA